MPSCLGSYRERQRSSHLLSDRVKRGPRGMGCGLCHTRESLNEVQSHVSHLSALSDQILERVIPKDDRSWNVLVCRCGLNGRSCERLCQKNLCRCEVHEIPKDDRSSNELDDLSGRSFLLRGLSCSCLSKDGQKKVGLFLERVIPKDGLNEKLAYARLLNLSRVSQNYGRYKKVCLTSSFFPGGRRLVLRCEACLTTRA